MLVDGILRRRLALVALAERRLRDNYFGRAASFYAWGIAVSDALLVAVAPRSAWLFVERALAAGVGIVGALAVGAALRDASNPRSEDALAALAREAGFGGASVHTTRAAAAAWRTVRALAAPAVLLAACAFAASLGGGKP